jgi:tRNA-splicing ligase RtcB (3'-phosphate/5'-hydroxy nucleic acid ligase)
MFELQGKYSRAKVYSESQDEKAIGQIIELCNQPFTTGANIRIMPDYHYGAGCTIGFTANLGNKAVPNLVGVDIGCGMLTVELGKVDFDFECLDNIIHEKVPAGKTSHKSRKVKYVTINDILCLRDLKHTEVFEKQIGTLGGGNHFIEVDKDDEGNFYLVIHSGSRNLGKQVADFYQTIAIENCKGLGDLKSEKMNLVEQYKSEGKRDQIQSALRELEKRFSKQQPHYPRDLCFVEGLSREEYLHDMKICQEYASLNRRIMADIILKNYFNKLLADFESFETVHNYISFKDNIIRKGAVSALEGERLIVPINMRDGSLLCTGKGNSDWNNSAPHGAGRLMGRSEAKRQLVMDDFKNSMVDVYSSTVNESTLDEAPMAYKSMQEIIDNTQDTLTVNKIIKPVYNFKSAE